MCRARGSSSACPASPAESIRRCLSSRYKLNLCVSQWSCYPRKPAVELREQAGRECLGGCQSAFVVWINSHHSAELGMAMGS